MNRSFVSVIFGGFGADDGAAPAKREAASRRAKSRSISASETAELLRDAKQVVIVPGYGMAVAHAQYPVYEIAELLAQARASTSASPFTRWRGACRAT